MVFRKSHVVLICASVLVVVLGIVGLSQLKALFSYLITKRLPLGVGSESYEGWKKIPFPIYQRFYYFNITNPQEFLRGLEKPNVAQVGPYTWRSEWTKEAVQWNANGTVQYRERRRFWFDRDNSVGDQDDIVTTINAPLVGASQRVKNMSPLAKLAVSIFLNTVNETITIKRSIRQLTYEGYKDVLAELSHILDKDMPIKNGKFAYMSGKNDTDEGLFNVFTGRDNIEEINRIDMWNGRTKLPWWDANSTCAEIRGTNGELMAPIKASDKSVFFFTPSFCKPWKLTKLDETVDSFGVNLARFVAGPEILFNSSHEPSHKCYEQLGSTLPSGGMDISRCQFGLPLVLSYPHFYGADEEYLQKIDGLRPNKSLHQFMMDIEPRIGVALGLKARAQVNIKLTRVPFLSLFRDIPEVVLPVFWQEMDISQTDSFAKHLQMILDWPMVYAEIAFIFMISCGAFVSLCTFIHVGVVWWHEQQAKRTNDEKSHTKIHSPTILRQRSSPIRKIGDLFCPPTKPKSISPQTTITKDSTSKSNSSNLHNLSVNSKAVVLPTAPTMLNNSFCNTTGSNHHGDSKKFKESTQNLNQWRIQNVLSSDDSRESTIVKKNNRH